MKKLVLLLTLVLVNTAYSKDCWQISVPDGSVQESLCIEFRSHENDAGQEVWTALLSKVNSVETKESSLTNIRLDEQVNGIFLLNGILIEKIVGPTCSFQIEKKINFQGTVDSLGRIVHPQSVKLTVSLDYMADNCHPNSASSHMEVHGKYLKE